MLRILAPALLFALVGCTGSTAEVRLQQYFGPAANGTPEQIEAALLEKIPLGTSDQSVIEFLGRSGIGKDRLSSYSRVGAGSIVCRIELDPNSSGIVKSSYGISFEFDLGRTLKSVKVQHWLTGP